MALCRYLKLIVLLCLVCALSFSVEGLSKTLYKWIDKKGGVHLTDYPPTSGEATQIQEIEVKEQKEPSEKIPADEQDLAKPAQQKPPDSALPSATGNVPGIDLDQLMKMSGSEMPFPLSGEMMKLLEVAGTAIFIISFALSMFINLYLALCIYLIARKTDVSYAWMAFVPILNIFPLFGAAGYRWHLALVIVAAAILSCLPYLLLPQVAFAVTIVMAIAILIFFINLWMKICENLGTGKWLGLLIIVPLFNLVLLSYLAFKKETSWDGVRRLRPAVITLIAFFIIVGAYAVSAPSLVIPHLKEMLSTLSVSGEEEGPGIVIMPDTGPATSQYKKKAGAK